MYQIGFLGLGKMGSSILKGILMKDLYKKEEIIFYAPSKETKEKYQALGINLAKDENEIFSSSRIIFLAVKPQKYEEIFTKLKVNNYSNKIIVSLAPGKNISYLRSIFPDASLVRAMPNTSALINKSVTTLTFEKEPIEEILNIFSSIGIYSIVEESQIDEAIPLNGSMPAYIYEFVKAFYECAEEYGMNKEEAKKLALHTIIGSCMLALDSDEDLDTLIDNVCSKGGSTIMGLNELRNNGFNETIKKCYRACVKRSKELANV